MKSQFWQDRYMNRSGQTPVKLLETRRSVPGADLSLITRRTRVESMRPGAGSEA